jgi:anti-anti-sigma factor
MPEPFNLGVDVFEDVPALRLRGGLVFGQDLHALPETVTRLRNEGHDRVIVDLTAVELTDSTGVSALLEIRHIIGERTGQVILLRVPNRLRATLVMTHVASLFELVEDEADLRQWIGARGPT